MLPYSILVIAPIPYRNNVIKLNESFVKIDESTPIPYGNNVRITMGSSAT